MKYDPIKLLHESLDETIIIINKDKDDIMDLTKESRKYHEQRLKLIHMTLSEMQGSTMREAVELLKENEKTLDNPYEKKPLRAGVLSGAQKEDYNKNDQVEPTSPENEEYKGRPEDEEEMIL